jgi:hypothetical protein
MGRKGCMGIMGRNRLGEGEWVDGKEKGKREKEGELEWENV